MEKTTYQKPEIRNSNDQIIQSGAYGKNSAFCNSQNTGVLDYINNNLEALKTILDTASGNVSTLQTNVTTLQTDVTQAQSDIEDLSSDKVDLSAYNAKMTELDGSITDLSDGKANKATTLAGYGITDAKIASGVITLGSNTITPLTSHQSLSGYVTKSSPKDSDSKVFERVYAYGSTYIRYTSGLQICWDNATISSGNANITVTFPVAFKDGPKLVASADGQGDVSATVSSCTASNCVIYSKNGSGEYHWNRIITYIAIGVWK